MPATAYPPPPALLVDVAPPPAPPPVVRVGALGFEVRKFAPGPLKEDP